MARASAIADSLLPKNIQFSSSSIRRYLLDSVSSLPSATPSRAVAAPRSFSPPWAKRGTKLCFIRRC
ncbi:hypothetical protein M413DRAFT_33082 [Hebeloma cylindrosporum]|uniref:Uncharacterized protein n=1 Tax=Hebeloma cylindrosporum TaxID=76867 RepID=A0A0C2Y0T6_HEBCY|nr:hypothetical protein M413DRAFT_33082 [Hebeloma cylindrosporum h7]